MDLNKTRHRWEDPLLTALTILMMVMMFVVAPLQALGVFAFQVCELLLAMMMVAGSSSSPAATPPLPRWSLRSR